MSSIVALSLSMALLLAAFPLVSIGATQNSPALWWLGLASLGVGGIIPPMRRFLAASHTTPAPNRTGEPDDDRV